MHATNKCHLVEDLLTVYIALWAILWAALWRHKANRQQLDGDAMDGYKLALDDRQLSATYLIVTTLTRRGVDDKR